MSKKMKINNLTNDQNIRHSTLKSHNFLTAKLRRRSYLQGATTTISR